MSRAAQTHAGVRPDGRRRYHPTDYGDRQCPLWPSALETARPALLDRYASLVRWGELCDTPSEILTFRLDPVVRRWVMGAGHLAEWAWPRRMPEDPTFLVHGEPLITTCSRSGRVAVFASAEEHAEITREHGVRLVEPLGAVCEPWPTP